MEPQIQVRGIRELRGALKKIDSETPARLRAGFRAIAEKVVGKASGKVPSRSGDARASVKPRATTSGAGIAFGGSKAPYYPWLDFGGRVGRNKSIVRPFVKEGRYIYPTISEMNQEIKEDVDALIADAIKDAGFDTKGSGAK